MYSTYFLSSRLFNAGSFCIEFGDLNILILVFVHKCKKGHIIFKIKSIKVEYKINKSKFKYFTFYYFLRMSKTNINIF